MKPILLAVAVLALVGLHPAADGQTFTEWSTPVNLGPVVNSGYTEAGAFISKDGLSLFFGSSGRPDGYGGFDLYVCQRDTVDDLWEPAQNLGPEINTSANEQTPALSVDGHRLYFASDRTGGFGGLDLYVSRRHDKRDDLGWQPPVNLGDAVNTFYVERGPTLFDDDATATTTLYFSSTRPGGTGLEDIYTSTLQPDETIVPAVNVPELNSTFNDAVPAVRRDGLELFLCSPRTGQLGGTDLWVATRPSTSEPWSTPANLGTTVNSTFLDFRAAISFDGTALYFHSARPGGIGGGITEYDLYVTTRTKITGRDKK